MTPDPIRERAEKCYDDMDDVSGSDDIRVIASALREVQRETAEECARIADEAARNDREKEIPTIGTYDHAWFMRHEARTLARAIRARFFSPQPQESKTDKEPSSHE